MQAELEAEQQTPLMDIRRMPSRFEVPPPLPAMDEPDVYVLHPDAMQTNTRKKLIRLDECDISTEVSARNLQPQGPNRAYVEAL